MIRATVSDVRQWMKDANEHALQYALRIGNALIEIRELCRRSNKPNKQKFGDYFPKNDDERDDPRKLPFVRQVGYRLIAIAENEVLVTHALQMPSDWTSLYQLSRIPAPQLTKLIEHKEVTPAMTRAEASKLAKSKAAAPAPAATPKPPKAKPADRPDMQAVASRLEQKYTVGELEELVAVLQASIAKRVGRGA